MTNPSSAEEDRVIGVTHIERMAAVRTYTIYQHPADFPTVPYVVRGWHTTKMGTVASGEVAFADTLEQARGYIPEGMYNLDRDPDDDPVIVETWV